MGIKVHEAITEEMEAKPLITSAITDATFRPPLQMFCKGERSISNCFVFEIYLHQTQSLML